MYSYFRIVTVTISPHLVLRYEAGRVDRVAWAVGVDSEVVGPVPVPAMSASTRASVYSIRGRRG